MLTWIVTGLIVWAAIAVVTFALLTAAGRTDRMTERRRAADPEDTAGAAPPGERFPAPPAERERAAEPGERSRLGA